MGASSKSRSGALEARHCASNCLDGGNGARCDGLRGRGARAGRRLDNAHEGVHQHGVHAISKVTRSLSVAQKHRIAARGILFRLCDLVYTAAEVADKYKYHGIYVQIQ